ncbi:MULTISPECIES: hypothetical protein [unclassified Streptomyces]|uniref:hypothetical protein n=1 Tax=unclassified Streptomyces TaxID=2593676 RepID=UPI001EF3C459|nr:MULTISPECIES: hypothetical protein [unclassified Streptomyces]
MITGAASLWDKFDRMRGASGFLTPAELLELADSGSVVLDPFSVILSKHVTIGPGNLFYPGVVIECDDESHCVIGGDNVFHGGTRIAASAGGSITIGDRSVIGEGGAQIKSTTADSEVSIGDGVRIANGAELLGRSRVGTGCQILGPISARSVSLADGATHAHPNPDRRGAVLKGFGRAQDIRLGVGEVINGAGDFGSAPVERQRVYHPLAPNS